MTTAHRPTWAPARGGEEQGGTRLFVPSKQISAKNQASHTKLKFRCGCCGASRGAHAADAATRSSGGSSSAAEGAGGRVATAEWGGNAALSPVTRPAEAQKHPKPLLLTITALPAPCTHCAAHQTNRQEGQAAPHELDKQDLKVRVCAGMHAAPQHWA